MTTEQLIDEIERSNRDLKRSMQLVIRLVFTGLFLILVLWPNGK